MNTLTETTATVLELQVIKAQIKGLQSLLPAPTPPTQRTVTRRDLNTFVKTEINTFSNVFKFVRKEILGLPNRVTLDHVQNSGVFLKETLLSYCSESLSEKSKETFYLDRLPKLITNIEHLKKCGLTERAALQLNLKVWTATAVIDCLVKGLTLSPKIYEAISNK